jgi:glycosyltransferase involved in cell wall biosynthesis
MFQGLSVAVVVPAYNEECRIDSTLRTLPSLVDVVVVVDDASGDATRARALASADPRVAVLRHRDNRGVGGAIISGYREVLRRGLDVAVVMAGDGQMDPADLPALLAPLAADEADYVKGNRFLHPDVWRTMPRLRIFGNLCLSVMTRPASGYRDILDSQCGYTAASADLLRKIDFDRVYPRYGFPNDFLAHVHSAGGRLAQVCVRPVYAGEASGINPVRSILPLSYVVARSFALRLWRERRARPPVPPPLCGTGSEAVPAFSADEADPGARAAGTSP